MWNMYRLKRFGPVFKCPKSTCRSVANHQGRETMCSTSNGIQKENLVTFQHVVVWYNHYPKEVRASSLLGPWSWHIWVKLKIAGHRPRWLSVLTSILYQTTSHFIRQAVMSAQSLPMVLVLNQRTSSNPSRIKAEVSKQGISSQTHPPYDINPGYSRGNTQTGWRWKFDPVHLVSVARVQ